MIEEREREKSAVSNEWRRLSTRVLLGGLAFVILAFVSIPAGRDLIGMMFRETSEPPPAAPPSAPALFSLPVPAEDPDAVALKRAAGIPLNSELHEDGKVVDQEDIRFAMELMNFMQGAPPSGKRKAEGAPAKAAGD
ncbi:hypothetical protein [Luteolibacter marinus]|uniref:hypothetical protein n=1 Tax=Luteolibacter marinus TaxID=2776705 RepID=UPI001D024A4E|nr:hypothetical protein [Luteolibacter marinus]